MAVVTLNPPLFSLLFPLLFLSFFRRGPPVKCRWKSVMGMNAPLSTLDDVVSVSFFVLFFPFVFGGPLSDLLFPFVP